MVTERVGPGAEALTNGCTNRMLSHSAPDVPPEILDNSPVETSKDPLNALGAQGWEVISCDVGRISWREGSGGFAGHRTIAGSLTSILLEREGGT